MNTLIPQTLSQQLTVISSSKQLPRKLEIKITDAYKAEECYWKTATYFQGNASSVHSVIKEWQSVGMVEAKMQSGIPRLLFPIICWIAMKPNRDLILTGKVFFCSHTCANMTFILEYCVLTPNFHVTI